MKIVLAVLLVSECAATEKAGVRRMAEHQVASCIAGTRCTRPEVLQCYLASEIFCYSHNMERTCGYGGSPGVCKP